MSDNTFINWTDEMIIISSPNRIQFIGSERQIAFGNTISMVGVDEGNIESAINHEVLHCVICEVEEDNAIPMLDNIWWTYESYRHISDNIKNKLSGLAEYGLGYP